MDQFEKALQKVRQRQMTHEDRSEGDQRVRDALKTMEEMVVPQSPAELAMMLALGPIGGKAFKGASMAAGLLASDDAEAGLIKLPKWVFDKAKGKINKRFISHGAQRPIDLSNLTNMNDLPHLSWGVTDKGLSPFGSGNWLIMDPSKIDDLPGHAFRRDAYVPRGQIEGRSRDQILNREGGKGASGTLMKLHALDNDVNSLRELYEDPGVFDVTKSPSTYEKTYTNSPIIKLVKDRVSSAKSKYESDYNDWYSQLEKYLDSRDPEIDWGDRDSSRKLITKFRDEFTKANPKPIDTSHTGNLDWLIGKDNYKADLILDELKRGVFKYDDEITKAYEASRHLPSQYGEWKNYENIPHSVVDKAIFGSTKSPGRNNDIANMIEDSISNRYDAISIPYDELNRNPDIITNVLKYLYGE